MTAPLDLDALERAALAATPGPWSLREDPYSGERHYMVVGPNDAPLFDSVNRSPAADPFAEMADMQFAAAANPATILKLIRRLRAAEADAERYRCVRRGQHWSVIDGIGDTLRAEGLDEAIDDAMKK